MEYQNIKIKIDEKGKVYLDVSGANGNKCVELTKELEKLLGEIEERTFKPEYYDETKETDNYLTNNL